MLKLHSSVQKFNPECAGDSVEEQKMLDDEGAVDVIRQPPLEDSQVTAD